MVEYTYLVGSLITVLIWIILFYYRKDLRKEMWIMGIIFGIAGLIMEALFYTKDWWNPPTITGSLIGIEDFLFGFGIAGVSAVIYEEVFRKRLVSRKKMKHPHTKQLSFLILLSIISFSFSFYILNYNSFISGLVATLIPLFIIYIIRPDLILDSLVSGFIIVIIAFIDFAILNIIKPNFVYSWWLLDQLTGIVFLGVPLEDIIWFLTTGMYIGCIYEFWQGERLKSI